MKNLKYLFIGIVLLNSNLTFTGNKVSGIAKNNLETIFTLEELSKKLLNAAKENNIKKIKEIIKLGNKLDKRKWQQIYLNAKDETGTTLLMWLCSYIKEYSKYAEKLNNRILSEEIKNQKEIDHFFKYSDLSTKLIKYGTDINIKNNTDQTASTILDSQNKNIVKLLDQTQKSNQNLIEKLIIAIQNNDKKTIKEWLIKNPILVDINGNNPLHIASQNNNAQIFNIIAYLRPRLFNEKNYDGQTPTDVNPQIIALLISTGRLNFIK